MRRFVCKIFVVHLALIFANKKHKSKFTLYKRLNQKNIISCFQYFFLAVRCRSIGVSNFGVHHLEGLKKAGLPTPSVNQIELHPWMRRDEIVDYCHKEGIAVMGYSPVAKGTRFDDADIKALAKK